MVATLRITESPRGNNFLPSIQERKARVANKPFSNIAIEKIYKDTWQLMGREDQPANKGRYCQWSGHSCRVGATQDLSTNGATLPQIMAEGGWKNTETAMR